MVSNLLFGNAWIDLFSFIVAATWAEYTQYINTKCLFLFGSIWFNVIHAINILQK